MYKRYNQLTDEHKCEERILFIVIAVTAPTIIKLLQMLSSD